MEGPGNNFLRQGDRKGKKKKTEVISKMGRTAKETADQAKTRFIQLAP